MAVVRGEDLAAAGVTHPIELPRVAPGLSVSLAGASLQTYMRGVGTFLTDATAESPIAYSINGVYIARPTGVGPIFFDLDRVEILRGPQGTLYGRNASGGAINLITRRPDWLASAIASVEIGNYGLARLTGVADIPLGRSLAVRTAGQLVRRDGYLTDGYNDQKSEAGRLTSLWEPSAGVSVLIIGELTHQGGNGDVPVKRSLLTPVPDNPWQGPSIGTVQQPPTAFLPGGARISTDGFQDIDVAALSSQVEVDLGAATLTFIPAWRRVEVDARNYVPGFPFDRHEKSTQWSAEARVAGEAGRLDWLAGVFFLSEDQEQHYELLSPPIQQLTVNTPLSTRSYAVFGDVTFAVSGRLRLIGGLRYTHDRKWQEGFTQSLLPTVSFINNEGRRTFDDISWRAGAEYDLGPSNLLFATAATGHKAGGFFPSVPAPDNSFEPERVTAFTLGSRSRFWGDRLRLALEAFHWTYDDKQERFVGLTTAGPGLLTTNAGRARLYGARADLGYRPAIGHNFSATVEYLNSRYVRFAYDVYNPPIGPFINSYQPEATGCHLGPAVPFTANDSNPALTGDSIQTIDCSGKPLVRAPKWTGAVAYEATFGLSPGRELIARVDATYASSQYLSVDFIRSGRDDGYFLTNAAVKLKASEQLSVAAWIRNILDEPVYTGGFRYVFSPSVAAGGDPTLFYATIREPRTYGLTVRAQF